MIHGLGVILHFVPVVTLFWIDLFEREYCLIDIGLCAFNAAGCRRLLNNMHVDEEIDVWYKLRERV